MYEFPQTYIYSPTLFDADSLDRDASGPDNRRNAAESAGHPRRTGPLARPREN